MIDDDQTVAHSSKEGDLGTFVPYLASVCFD